MGGRRFAGGNKPPQEKTEEFRPHDVTAEHTSPFHDPDEEIVGKPGLRVALAEMNGPNYFASKHVYKNIRKAVMLASGHHCGDRESGHAETKQCHESGHMGYCPEHVDVEIDGVVYRCRCGMRYTVESDGCGHPEHRRAWPGSMSRLICDMWQGKVKVTTWRRFNDPRLNELWDEKRKQNPTMSKKDIQTLVQQKQDAVEALAASGTAGKAAFEEHGDWHVYIAEEKARADREKLQAAQHKLLNDKTIGDLNRGRNGAKMGLIQNPHSKARKAATHGQKTRRPAQGGKKGWGGSNAKTQGEENKENEEKEDFEKDKKGKKAGKKRHSPA